MEVSDWYKCEPRREAAQIADTSLHSELWSLQTKDKKTEEMGKHQVYQLAGWMQSSDACSQFPLSSPRTDFNTNKTERPGTENYSKRQQI